MTQEQAKYLLTLEHLWQFSIQYYSVRAVKEACLSLQNNYHGNVNLLLLLKWLESQDYDIQEQDWQRLLYSIASTEALLQSYREIRRKLKGQVPETLYRESLQFELQLEKQQQSDLVDCVNTLPLQQNAQSSLVSRYCKQLNAEHLATVFDSLATH